MNAGNVIPNMLEPRVAWASSSALARGIRPTFRHGQPLSSVLRNLEELL
jgi:hypothetical protein